MTDFFRIELRVRNSSSDYFFYNGSVALSNDNLVIYKDGRFHYFRLSSIQEFYIEIM